MTDSVTFSSFELIVNGHLPTSAFLKSAFFQTKRTMAFDQVLHQVECEVIEDRFYWFYSNYGKAMPHRDIVIDFASGDEQKNPRTTEQVEPNNQLFVMYDSKSTLLYISNLQKKGFFKDYLTQFTDNEIIIKNVYKTIEEFIDEISSLETIKFTGSRDLFNSGGDLFSPLRDIFGYGEPDEFSIEAKYHTPMKDAIKRELLRLAGYQNQNDIKTLVCIGKDEKGFEKLFNTNYFIHKISLPIQKDNQLLFPPETVKEQAVLKLRGVFGV